MVPIKKCKWNVRIMWWIGWAYWKAFTEEEIGAENFESAHLRTTIASAKRDWKKFAKENGIKNWSFVK